jgi:hypothetical protein
MQPPCKRQSGVRFLAGAPFGFVGWNTKKGTPCATSPTAEATRSERVQSEFESRVTYQLKLPSPSGPRHRSYKPTFRRFKSCREYQFQLGGIAAVSVSRAQLSDRASARHAGNTRFDFSTTYHSFLSSMAEHPADNRTTADRYREEGPRRPLVITGLVPVIPLRLTMPCVPQRDGRDKPGHDERLGPYERNWL